MDLDNMTKEDIIKLEPHIFAGKYPMADEQEFNLLKESIEKYGVQIPIQIYEGKILDGRNRHLAVVELIKNNPNWFTEDKVKFEEYIKDDAELYADHLNLVRRHLTAGQKAILAVKFYEKEYEKIKKEADERGKARAKMLSAEKKKAEKDPTYVIQDFDRAPTSNKLFGEVVGVNEEYIRKALKIKEISKELLDNVYEGNVDINTAFKIVNIKVVDFKTGEIDEELVEKRKHLIERVIDGDDYTTTKTEYFRKEINAEKAQTPDKLGIFFSFPIDSVLMKEIKSILHKGGYYYPEYQIWVGRDEKAREAIENIKGTLKLKCYNESGVEIDGDK